MFSVVCVETIEVGQVNADVRSFVCRDNIFSVLACAAW